CPVEAPLGTAARPTAPLSRPTSASNVGLPRESRISRARTVTIPDMLLRLLQHFLDLTTDETNQLIAVLLIVADGRYRLAEANDNPAFPYTPVAFLEHRATADNSRRHDVDVCVQREHERAFFEGQQLAIPGARSLREDHDCAVVLADEIAVVLECTDRLH